MSRYDSVDIGVSVMLSVMFCFILRLFGFVNVMMLVSFVMSCVMISMIVSSLLSVMLFYVNDVSVSMNSIIVSS